MTIQDTGTAHTQHISKVLAVQYYSLHNPLYPASCQAASHSVVAQWHCYYYYHTNAWHILCQDSALHCPLAVLLVGMHAQLLTANTTVDGGPGTNPSARSCSLNAAGLISPQPASCGSARWCIWRIATLQTSSYLSHHFGLADCVQQGSMQQGGGTILECSFWRILGKLGAN